MKKWLSCVLALCCAFSAAVLSGCGKKVPDTEETLEVYVLDAGYGVNWCDDLLELFKQQEWVKEKYPNLQVVFTYNNVRSYGSSRLEAGSRSNTIDLLFDIDLNKYNYAGPTGDFEDLTDSVYNSTVPGEGDVKWIDKSTDSYDKSNLYADVTGTLEGDHYYMTSWVDGMVGFLYNETLLNNLNIEVPRTTDQLLKACETIKSTVNNPLNTTENGYCFIQGKENTYWDYLHDIWWAQYEGIENYRNFWNGYDAATHTRSTKIFDQRGKLETLKVYESLLDYNKGYYNPSSSTYNFIQAQTLFLQGKAAFCVNGDWFDNEMRPYAEQIKKENGRIDTIKMMRTPIVSALGEKLGITDDELSAIVDYVDGTTAQEPEFTSTKSIAKNKVINAVREARTVIYSLGPNHNAAIPKYANGKKVAIDFLRFMATDVANEQFIKTTNGVTLPFDYDVKTKNPTLYESLSPLQKSRLDYFASDKYETYTLPSTLSFPLAKYGGLKANVNEYYLSVFAAKGNTTMAQDIIDATKQAWTDSKWRTACNNAGLNV